MLGIGSADVCWSPTFRQYRTRNGRFVMHYRLTQTFSPTVYIMRAKVPGQSGYAYEEGYSRAKRLRVLP